MYTQPIDKHTRLLLLCQDINAEQQVELDVHSHNTNISGKGDNGINK